MDKECSLQGMKYRVANQSVLSNGHRSCFTEDKATGAWSWPLNL